MNGQGKAQTREPRLKCPRCKSRFVKKRDLIHHSKIHNRPISKTEPKSKNGQPRRRKFECIQCETRFTRGSHLRRHFLMHLNGATRPFKCPLSGCSSSFGRKDHLTRHLKAHSKATKRSTTMLALPFEIKCPECGKLFQRQQLLRTHVQRIHVKSELTMNAAEMDHYLSHTEEKPYNCQVCGKSFSTERHRDSHMLSHPGGKRSICDICGKTFDYNLLLIRHKRRMHPDSEEAIKMKEKGFICDVCNRRLISEENLVRHKRRFHEEQTETGEKPVPMDSTGVDEDTFQLQNSTDSVQMISYEEVYSPKFPTPPRNDGMDGTLKYSLRNRVSIKRNHELMTSFPQEERKCVFEDKWDDLNSTVSVETGSCKTEDLVDSHLNKNYRSEVVMDLAENGEGNGNTNEDFSLEENSLIENFTDFLQTEQNIFPHSFVIASCSTTVADILQKYDSPISKNSTAMPPTPMGSLVIAASKEHGTSDDKTCTPEVLTGWDSHKSCGNPSLLAFDQPKPSIRKTSFRQSENDSIRPKKKVRFAEKLTDVRLIEGNPRHQIPNHQKSSLQNESTSNHLHQQTSVSEGESCIFCGKQFATDVGLNAHLLLHIDERPFFCLLCDFSSPLRECLRKHMRERHSKTETVTT